MEYILQRYHHLINKADRAFNDTAEKYSDLVRCELHCADCCHAIFGLFMIEAYHMRKEFEKLDEDTRRKALERASEADERLREIEKKFREEREKSEETPRHSLSTIRVRCPLLDENDECILYEHRPLTCRVYGIPTVIHGQAHVCHKSAFKPGDYYTVYNLDEAYKELYYLSRQLLSWEGGKELEKASLLISVSKCISTPTDELIEEVFK